MELEIVIRTVTGVRTVLAQKEKYVGWSELKGFKR